jgi:hypothetical protein
MTEVPRHGCVGWGIEGDEIVFGTLPDQQKLRNFRRDPRIALSVPSTRTGMGSARVPSHIRYGAGHRMRCGKAPAATCVDLPQTGRRLSEDAGSAIETCHQDHGGAHWQRRPVEPRSLSRCRPGPVSLPRGSCGRHVSAATARGPASERCARGGGTSSRIVLLRSAGLITECRSQGAGQSRNLPET